MPQRLLGLAAAFAVAATVVGCGGGSSSESDEPNIVTPSTNTCATPTATPAAWPSGVPTQLPRPPGMSNVVVEHLSQGRTALTFTVPMPLRASLLFVLNNYPKAGFQLGHGDSEAQEADVPFAGNGYGAAMKISVAGACLTRWRMVLARR